MKEMNDREVIRLVKTTRLSNRAIERLTKVSRTTIGKYRKRLDKNDIEWSRVEKMNDIEIDSLLRKKRQCTNQKRPIDAGYCVFQLEEDKNVTKDLLWQEYRIIDPKTAYSYTTFCYVIRRFKRKLDLSMRQIHRAGEKVFVDFAGTTIPYTDKATLEKHRAQIFVAVLGCSNYTFAHAVKSQTAPDWIEGHNQAFLYFGGVPVEVVPDNAKGVVIKAGSEPRLNRSYLEMCQYYNVVAVPARVRRPRDKAKAEVAVLIVTRWILAKLRKMTFFSIEEINQAISELLWQLNERPFKKLPGCRRSRFEQLDKPMLKPLPGKPYEYAEWIAKQKVSNDYHVCIKGHYYSVSHEIVGEYIEARVTKNIIEILFKGKVIVSHLRSNEVGGNTTLPAHQPASHRGYADHTPKKLKNWARKIGPAALAVVEYQFESCNYPGLALRPCASLKKMAGDYGDDRFEAACRRGQKIGSLTVTSIRSILRHKLDHDPVPDTPNQMSLPLHENLRGASYYEHGSA